jgi:YVTN family beta-propeller protein
MPVYLIPVGEDPTAIAADEDAVWVVESGGPSVSRISPPTRMLPSRRSRSETGPADVALGAGSVWVTNRFDGTLSRIDPNRGRVLESISVGLEPGGIAFAFGSVWVSLSGSNTVRGSAIPPQVLVARRLADMRPEACRRCL